MVQCGNAGPRLVGILQIQFQLPKRVLQCSRIGSLRLPEKSSTLMVAYIAKADLDLSVCTTADAFVNR